MPLTASATLDIVTLRVPQWFPVYNTPRIPQLKRLNNSDSAYADSQSRQPQNSSLRLGKWAVNTFGSLSAESAVLGEHYVANWNDPFIERWDSEGGHYWWNQETRKRVAHPTGPLEKGVPLTMRHWQILARLGKEPVSCTLVTFPFLGVLIRGFYPLRSIHLSSLTSATGEPSTKLRKTILKIHSSLVPGIRTIMENRKI